MAFEKIQSKTGCKITQNEQKNMRFYLTVSQVDTKQIKRNLNEGRVTVLKNAY